MHHESRDRGSPRVGWPEQIKILVGWGPFFLVFVGVGRAVGAN